MRGRRNGSASWKSTLPRAPLTLTLSRRERGTDVKLARISSPSPPCLTASRAGSPSGPRTFRESTNRAEAPAWSRQRRPLPPRGQEVAIEQPQTGAIRPRRPRPTQLRRGEGFRGLRIEDFHRPGKPHRRHVLGSSLPHRLGQRGLAEGAKEGERPLLAVFFPHEQQSACTARARAGRRPAAVPRAARGRPGDPLCRCCPPGRGSARRRRNASDPSLPARLP